MTQEGQDTGEVTPRLLSRLILAGLLRNAGLFQFGMLAAFPSERWPFSPGIRTWTQIAAMLSSLVYTLVYDSLYQNNSGFKLLMDTLCTSAGLSSYPLKIVILTTLVVCTWLTVMYCTKPDYEEHLRGFVEKTGTGGVWPKDFFQSDYRLPRRVFLCFIFAITYILPFIFIWEFKFGSSNIAIGLLLLFVGLVAYVYRSVSTLLSATETQQY